MDKLERLQRIRRDQEIDGTRIRLYFLTRNPFLLAGVASVILAISAGLGWCLQKPVARKPASGAVSKQIHSVAGNDDQGVFEGILEDASSERGAPDSKSDAMPTLAGPTSVEEKQVSKAFLESTRSFDGLPSADLLFYAHWVKPFPRANEFVADIHLSNGDVDAARKYYQRELQISGSNGVRRKLIDLLTFKRDFDGLASLSADPANAELIPEPVRIHVKAHQHEWKAIPEMLARYETKTWRPVPVFLALIAGLSWLVIALQAIQPRRLLSFRTIVPVIAVLVGALSTMPTLLADLWEETELGLSETGDFVNDLLYFVAGVGPREEVIKLVFFLPFLPFLLRRDSRLEALIVAACVGLGFAMEENIQYFAQAGPAVAFGRFLTANFFHMAATGTIGLALYEAIKSPRKNLLRFLYISVGVMVAHGFYDAFMAVAELQLLQIVSMVVFTLLSLFFFQQVRTSRDGFTDQFSLAATLVLGLSMLTGAIFVTAAMKLGFEIAGLVIAFNAIGLVMIAYMFYWQLGTAMSESYETSSPSYDYPF